MRLFGLIGKSLTHSFSKQFFAHKFSAEGIMDCRYELFELETIQQLPNIIQLHPELAGLNVTIPYKQAVLDFLDEREEIVEEIGACNCIKIAHGKLIGYNTDVVGFKNSLQSKLRPHHKKALVLGSGGASKAVQYALSELDIEYVVVSRHNDETQIGYEDIDKGKLDEYPLIINTTPLGMYPQVDADPSIPYKFISPDHFLYDLIYNPPKTKFLCEGEKQGAQICNGHDMLVGQAEESWRIWNEETAIA